MLTAAISEREFLADQKDRAYRTWEVKVLSKIFASSIPFENAHKGKKFMEQIDEVALELPAEKKLREEQPVHIDDQGAYERALLAFGGVPFDPEALQEGPQAMAQASGWQYIDEDGPEGFY